MEGEQAYAEAGCVLVGDREDPDAALIAARLADEVAAATGRCGGKCGIYDLNQGIGHSEVRSAAATRQTPVYFFPFA